MTDVATLSGRVAMVTGASGGIGAAIARGLAESGVDLFLTYGQHREDAERVADYARGLGRRVVTARGDLAQASAALELVTQAVEQFGGVDVLIANAGSASQASWDVVDLALWNTTLAVNLTGPFLLAQHTLPGMIERGFGRVLFVSSVAALNGGIVGPHYAASKAGLHGLTHHLALRVASHGVTVNALAPALVGDTRMLPKNFDGSDLPIPVGRLGKPAEIADMALAILRNGYLTSKVITIDGGAVPR